MPNVKCLRCGSELLADGALYGPSRLALRPDDTRFLTMESGHVMTKATMCRECASMRKRLVRRGIACTYQFDHKNLISPFQAVRNLGKTVPHFGGGTFPSPVVQDNGERRGCC